MIYSLCSWFFATLLNTLDLACFFLNYHFLYGKKKALPNDLQPLSHESSGLVSYSKSSNPEVESDVYRNSKHPNYLRERAFDGKETIDQLFAHLVTLHGSKPCMGKRPLVKIHKSSKVMPNGTTKVWEIPEFGPLTYWTYDQMYQRILNFGRGMTQFCDLNSGDRFAMFENTCMEWMMAAQAAYHYNITLVTVYANLGDEALASAFNETGVTSVLTNEDQLPKFHALSKCIPTLKNVIYVSSSPLEASEEELERRAQIIQKLKDETPLNVISFDEVEQLGSEQTEETAVQPRERSTKDSLAIIMFTSGTTGDPKGVLIKHSNMLAAASAVSESAELTFSEWTYLAYLPLAHILESVAELIILGNGGKIGYGTPRTLTDTGAKPCGDFAAVKPTLITGVPRIFDTIKKTVLSKLNEPGSSPIKRWLFNTAYAAKKHAIEKGRDTPLWNKLIFGKLKALMGGKAEMVLSGGAPLAPSTQEFVRFCFNASVIQGYGLTETSAGLTIQSMMQPLRPGYIGPVITGAELKLVSIPEMNYLTTDKNPRGEIWTRGPCVTGGYFGKPNHEDFDADGWFHTGDVGMISNGQIKIIDRKKNLVKMDHGEYVALEKVESVYANSPFVAPHGLFVYGDAQHSHVVGIVLPS